MWYLFYNYQTLTGRKRQNTPTNEKRTKIDIRYIIKVVSLCQWVIKQNITRSGVVICIGKITVRYNKNTYHSYGH